MQLKWKLSTAAALAAWVAGAAFAITPLPATQPAPALPPAFEDLDDVPLPDRDLWQRIRVGFAM
jgi:hypothetical protein